MITTPPGFPVWLQGPDGTPVFCQDALSYTLLAPKGYTFNNSNPPVSHPGSADAAHPTPPQIQVSVHPAQPNHPNPTGVR